MGPKVASELAFLVYSTYRYCLKVNCPVPGKDALYPSWIPCQVFKEETIPSSYIGGALSPLDSISGVSSSGDSGRGNPPAANPGSPGFRALKRFIS